MSTLNTTIKIRNDETANWATSSKVLAQGELALEYQEDGSVRVKAGNGSSTFKDLDYLNPGLKKAQVFIVELAPDELDIEAAIARVVGSAVLQIGDIAIVKAGIVGDKTSYTSYVYNGTKWEATDGNYSADNVYLKEDITMAGNYTQVGNLTKTQTGTATFATAGKTVSEAFTEIFSKRLQPTITAQPAASITLTQAGAYEVGTEITPSYTASLSAGSYTYGPATGITATSYTITDTAGHEASTASGSFAKFTVAENTNYKVTASIEHGAGAVAKDNLGANSNPEVKIAAGTKTKTSSAVTGYRNMFFGTITTKPETTTSDTIRGLATKVSKQNLTAKVIDIPVGALRVIFAVPSDKSITSITDTNGLGAEILSSFGDQGTPITVAVEGANGYTATNYKVYILDYANPNDKANTYKITVG